MLSPGKDYLLLDKDPVKNVETRLAIHERSETDAEFRAAIWDMCKHDLLFYVNAFIWQINPNKPGDELGPFITWPFQDRAFRYMLDCVECHCRTRRQVHGHDLCIEKSREMGASWMCIILMEWLWHFHANKLLLMVSRSEEAVDDASMDSLMAKIDFIHRHQPSWLLPKFKRTKRFYGNEDNGSQMSGEASTGRFGVGGRAALIFIDEFSQIREDREILHRTSDTSQCRIFNFTHTDPGNAAADLARRPDMRKLQMHWTEHPDKIEGLYQVQGNKVEVIDKKFAYPAEFAFVRDGSPTGGYAPGVRSPWYDDQCLRKGSRRAVAMDLDIDMVGSMSQVFNPITLRCLKEQFCIPPYWRGELEFDPVIPKQAKLQPDSKGKLKLWTKLDMEGRPPLSSYTVGVDTATGTGATPSCISIIDARLSEKVLEYSDSHIEPVNLAPLIVALCWLFKDEYDSGAYLAWEIPGPGLHLGKVIMEMGYRNVYWREEDSRFVQKQKYEIPGWNNSVKTKRYLIEEYRASLENRKLINRSESAIEECLNFKYAEGGKIEHSREGGDDDPSGARENHGDQTIADALAWKLAKKLNVRYEQKKAEESAVPLGSLAWRRRMDEEAKRHKDDWGESKSLIELGW